MLTRDISIEDCILDLVDNSVDSAWKALGSVRLGLLSGPDFSKVKIDLKVTPELFSIKDNCGGMSLESAKKYAFTFGRKAEDPADSAEFSIGVYGIGLKRAVFKLGKDINVRSTHRKKGGVDAFEVPIDVETWVKGTGTDWDFPIMDAEELPESGLDIEIKDLTDLAKLTFGDTEFASFLRRTIARDYSLHLHRGLSVTVNDVPVVGEIFKLFTGGDFEPKYETYVEKIGNEKVYVEIVAGFAFPPAEDNDPTEKRTEREEKSGWYVACNGRIVMAADKTALSVWGDEFPGWHPQYTGFFGLIVFSADATELLPLTTTKRSVDLSSIVYRRARPKMKEPTRAWIDYTNARKTDKASAEQEEAKAVQSSIFSVRPQAQVVLPQIRKARVRDTSLQFRMPIERVKRLALGFGDATLSNSEVGRKAFDYAYDDLAVEE
ncbi:ATP-binding protein [Brevundimonas sp.]|uniref:ATP-binding protein n=1 Tax=Brevundimonas sp. TaxID=1871086 RepID=UPI002D74B09E|nr:ATP-binding protein [Brevundimonas sp.]HYD27285.1 ATP-binding protein [Brevundimonas sp.]